MIWTNYHFLQEALPDHPQLGQVLASGEAEGVTFCLEATQSCRLKRAEAGRGLSQCLYAGGLGVGWGGQG